jgi:putative DNA primase/helicase
MPTPKSLIMVQDPRLRRRHHPDVHPHHGEDRPQEEYDYYLEVDHEPPDLTCQRLNDSGNAERFISIYGANLHYVPEVKQWLVWDGRRWRVDATNQVQSWAKLAMREFLWQAADTYNKDMLRFAERSLDVPRLRHLLEAAQSEPEIPIEVRELDRNPLLVNCRNGTFDLANFELYTHRREDLLTRLVDADYGPSAACPRFIQYMNEILPPELVAFVQRALGYSLSGDVRAKAAFLCYGPPNAGKSTLLGIIHKLMEEYSTLLLAQTLTTHSRGGDALADLADLRGVRFAQVSEIGQDEQLAQKFVKGVIQGSAGRVKARRKYANMIQFPETWKLWFDMNFLPRLSDPYDAGAAVRLYPIHFAKSVPPEKIDPALDRKLEGELAGILNWLIEGFRAYQQHGLAKPPLVDACLAGWFQESDHIPRFVDQCCLLGPRFSVELRPLFDAYQVWCEQTLEKPMGAPLFSQGMQHHGYQKGRSAKKRFYLGIKLTGLYDKS